MEVEKLPKMEKKLILETSSRIEGGRVTMPSQKWDRIDVTDWWQMRVLPLKSLLCLMLIFDYGYNPGFF